MKIAVLLIAILFLGEIGATLLHFRTSNQEPEADKYRLELVPTLGGEKTYHGGGAINNKGQVVGSATNSKGNIHAFFWEPGSASAVDLGTFGGFTSFGRAINDRTQVVGGAETQDGMRAFLWENGTLKNLGTLPGFHESIATGINEAGDIIGRAYTKIQGPFWKQPSIPVLWHGGEIRALPLPTGFVSGRAAAINNYGVIVGWAYDTTNHSTACSWEGSQVVNLGAVLGTKLSSANALNDGGEIVGTAGSSERDMRAFVYKGKSVDWIPFLPYQSSARAASIAEDGTVYLWGRVGVEILPISFSPPDHKSVRDILLDLPRNDRYFPFDVFGVNKSKSIISFGSYENDPDRMVVMSPNQ